MPNASAERLISLNDQAVALLRLGVPIDLGLGENPTERLEQINRKLTTVSQSEPSIGFVLNRLNASPRYEAIAKSLLAANDPTPIFQAITVTDRRGIDVSPRVRRSMVEPFIVLALAYLGMLLLCASVIPLIETEYEQLLLEPEGSAAFMATIRAWMPVWAWAFPLVLGLMVWFGGRLIQRLCDSLAPGGRLRRRWSENESQTQRLAALLESGVDRQTALDLVDRGSVAEQPVGPVTDTLLEEMNEQTPDGLRRLSGFYRFLDREQRFASKVPAFIGLTLASVIVLAYALALFLPWIDLLTHLSEAPRS